MPKPTPSFETIRDGILRDIRSVLPDADVTADSDHYVRAAGVGSAIEGLYQHQAWLYRQIWPNPDDTEELEKHAGDRGLKRKPAVAGTTGAQVTGTPEATVDAGLSLRHPSGAMLVTTTEATLGAEGMAQVRVRAVTAGASANGLRDAVSWISPPLGVDAQATLIEPVTGGVGEESNAELYERLIDLIQRPPAGGNRYDYQRWAREVPGVTAAYVYPLRRGLGTVDVVILAADGLPSDELIEAVQRYIDERRPVTAWDCLVFAPTVLTADVVAQLTLAAGYTMADLQAPSERQLANAMAPMAPGETLYRSHLEAVLSGLPGVIDRALVAPLVNLVPVVDASRVEWVRLGTVTLEPLA